MNIWLLIAVLIGIPFAVVYTFALGARLADDHMHHAWAQEFRGCRAPRCIYGTGSTVEQCRYCIHARRPA